MNTLTYILVGGFLLTLVLTSSLNKDNKKLRAQLSSIQAQSNLLKTQIEEHNEQLRKARVSRQLEIEQLEAQHLDALDAARAAFIAEQLRNNGSNPSCGEGSTSISKAHSTDARNTTERERLLLQTLDEAERINAAYTSCMELFDETKTF